MKASKKTLTLLVIATTLMLVFGGFYAGIFIAVKNKTEATTILLEKIDELSGRESRIASSVSILRRESANIDKISEYFFKESEVVLFTKKIEALGAQSGTTLAIESLDQGLTEKTVPFLNFRIKATGGFNDIGRLIMLLENFPGRLDWKTVQISRDTSAVAVAKGDGTPVWRFEAFLVALNFVN